MSKLLPKVGVSTPSPRLVSGGQPQTRATTAAKAANNVLAQPVAQIVNSNEGVITLTNPITAQPGSTDMPQSNAYHVIAEKLATVIKSGKLDAHTKVSVENVIKIAREAKIKEDTREISGGEQEKVSAICDAVQKDLQKLHNQMERWISCVQASCNTIINNTSKVMKGVEETKSDTKDLACRVDKVSDATDKIALDNSSYRDVLLSKPTPTNRDNADPRILSNMDRKAKQILVDIYNKDENNILTKSLTSIIDKANKAIAIIQDDCKPKEVKVIMALKTRRRAVLLTLNSKEAVKWLSKLFNKLEFANEFSDEAHIRERTYNLIVPRVPTTFEPSVDVNLRKIEEANSLDAKIIRKARWIKPMERRRPEQTHAYAIISLTSVESTNIIIRDGLIICGMKVRPTKQKHEPLQCMKCRRWGHLAVECSAEKDVCGNCGKDHRTSTCKDRSNPFCIACNEDTHASWSRNCLEFLRRCSIHDKRNPENAMQYFPTGHDWSLAVRPNSILLTDRFPGKYAVNMIPYASDRQQTPRQCQPFKGQKGGASDRHGCENPNRIQISHNRPRGDGELPEGGEWLRANMGARIDSTEENAPDTPSTC